MKESNLAENFKNIFLRYNPQVIVNNAVSGWPDRMLQDRTTAVFVELKLVSINKNGTFKTGLRQDQAAWLAKWQRKGGKCFMFMGFVVDDKFEQYGILTMLRWSMWLQVPKTKYDITKLDLASKMSYDLLYWFKWYLDN